MLIENLVPFQILDQEKWRISEISQLKNSKKILLRRVQNDFTNIKKVQKGARIQEKVNSMES